MDEPRPAVVPGIHLVSGEFGVIQPQKKTHMELLTDTLPVSLSHHVIDELLAILIGLQVIRGNSHLVGANT